MLVYEAWGRFVSLASHWEEVAINGTITCTYKLPETETN